MENIGFAFVALFILVFGLVSERLQRSIITAPMAFALFGVVMGPEGLGLLHIGFDSEVVRELAEATLVIVLFTDASRIDLKILKKNYELPLRLLSVGLPLTILGGTLLAALLLDTLTFWEAAVVAAILAPTDAALGQAVVSSPKVPVRIRQALNVESGLNDGIALPVVLFFIHLAASSEGTEPGQWLNFVSHQLILGPAVGAAVGFLGGQLVERGVTSQWMSHAFQQISAVAIALLAFAGAEAVGGNGFIAAFVAGLVLGNTAKRACTCLIEFAEAEGQLLTLFAFLVFGVAEIGPILAGLSAPLVLYAVLSLTLIRMIPVSLSLLGAGLRWPTHLFLGWFGPRGLASILYIFLVLEESGLQGGDDIFTVVMCTVLLSIFAHGVTAWPASELYSRHAEKLKNEEPSCAEHKPVEELPVRVRMAS
ncbi:MAG: sodium:proton antiporter [Acidobacteria bacterium]|nr:sodium:proton antiporter [Acidobacteriota bacterium]